MNDGCNKAIDSPLPKNLAQVEFQKAYSPLVKSPPRRHGESGLTNNYSPFDVKGDLATLVEKHNIFGRDHMYERVNIKPKALFMDSHELKLTPPHLRTFTSPIHKIFGPYDTEMINEVGTPNFYANADNESERGRRSR